jgi:hypothetical protein
MTTISLPDNKKDYYELIENDKVVMSGSAREFLLMASVARAGLFEVPQKDQLRIYTNVRLIEESIRI